MTNSTGSTLSNWSRYVAFGRRSVVFEDEYLEFQYRFLIVLMIAGAVLTGLFVLGTFSELNPVGWSHTASMIVFTTVSVVLWLTLRGHPKRYLGVAWTYEIFCLLESTSALVYVSVDELRVLWFLTNVPGVFILLGQRAGWAITLTSVVCLLLGNSHLERPYSPNALATVILCQIYLGVYFHAFMDRSVSFFTRMRDFNHQLLELASHDPLTGVMNPRAYYQSCDQLIRASHRSNQPFAVLFVDLDHFKSINDTHGHAAGDEVLRSVAQALKRHIRASDLLGRIGGEEFSVFLPNTDLAGALQLGEVLRQSVERLDVQIGATHLRVTASVGVACKRFQGQNMQSIQQRADEAMYAAKREGRNRVSTLDTPESGAGQPQIASASPQLNAAG